MTGWEGSQRRDELPDNWPELRREVIRRARGQCEWRLPKTGKRCPRRGTDVDHFGGKHDHTKLRLLCTEHHAKHTAKQAKEARIAFKRRGRRASEAHPGSMGR